MKMHFFGADHAVTGSCHCVEVGGYRVLVDCGLQQGRDEADNSSFPFVPAEIDAVIVTHAHIDHSGRLPLLVKRGFEGKIYATSMTCRLLRIMLLDSAHIQESEAEYVNRKGVRAGKASAEPLYTIADAELALTRLVPVEYGAVTHLCDGMEFRMTDAGHLLGSAYVELWAEEHEIERKIVFSGDIGNVDQPVIRNPAPVSEADYVVMESTYGNRNHERPEDYISCFTEILNETFAKGGNVIIPSFAVGRTQELLYFFREIKERALVTVNPDFEVVVDSPLAAEATKIFSGDLSGYLDEEATALAEKGTPLFTVSNTRLVLSSEESKTLNTDLTPRVIISASGMCDAGRIRHHLKHNLWRPECCVVFVGFQAPGSFGRALLEGKQVVKLFGEEVQVKAKIMNFVGLSSHADHDHLLSWIDQFPPERLSRVFVVHGDSEVTDQFAEELRKQGIPAHAPLYRESYDLLVNEVIEKGVLPEKKGTKYASGSQDYRVLEETGRLIQEAIRANKGLSNRELRKFNEQLQKVLKNWG